MNYNPEHSPQQLYEKHLKFGIVFNEPLAASEKPAGVHNSLKKIHIGYVSPDFCNHPVARFIEPILVHHDIGSFDIFCYSDVARPDAVTERLKKAPLHWRNINGLDDEKVEKAIRDDAIDILVDCAGHTAGNRLQVQPKLSLQSPRRVQLSGETSHDPLGDQ